MYAPTPIKVILLCTFSWRSFVVDVARSLGITFCGIR